MLARRFLSAHVGPAARVRLYLAVLLVMLAGTFAFLVFLALLLAPHWLMGYVGVGCVHEILCPHGLPVWGQFLVWLPPLALAGWVLRSVGVAAFVDVRANRRVRRMARARGRRLDSRHGIPVYEVADARLFACTAGIFRPLVVVSSGLRSSISLEEYEVIVAHEAAHAARRDNLGLLLAGAAAKALFFLPGVRRLRHDACRAMELAADLAAAESIGDRLSVASTVTRVAQLACAESGRMAPLPAAILSSPAGFAAVGHHDLVVERVERLIFGADPVSSRARLSAGVVALLIVFAVLCSAGYLAGTNGLGGPERTSTCVLARSA